MTNGCKCLAISACPCYNRYEGDQVKNFPVPADAEKVLRTLTSRGYQAYFVGGCVRDSLLGLVPKDWDICTSALPEQIMECFPRGSAYAWGIKHGTVCVKYGDHVCDITTFRSDGVYSDNRHPDRVAFVDDLYTDLSRRDFTVNAMAYSPDTGVADPFGGSVDAANKIVRCVGNAKDRFREDSLRILRALRFCSVYGFEAESATAEAINECKTLLHNVSAERVFKELCGILSGKDAGDVYKSFPSVFEEIIPELSPENADIDDKHAFISGSLCRSPLDPSLRLAVAFCASAAADPSAFASQECCERARRNAVAALKRLKTSNAVCIEVCDVITNVCKVSDPSVPSVKRALCRSGIDGVKHASLARRALGDAAFKLYAYKDIFDCERYIATAKSIVASGECFTLGSLAVNGSDLIGRSFPEGEAVGRALSAALDAVIDGVIANEKEAVLEFCTRFFAQEDA